MVITDLLLDAQQQEVGGGGGKGLKGIGVKVELNQTNPH